MGWRGVDERLIRCGELLLDLDFLEGYDEELESMNGGKEGRPFTLTGSHIGFLGVVRYLFSLPYRRLEGFAIALNRLVSKLPSGDYSGLRRRILELDLPLQGELRDSQEPVCIAVDSTGVRVHKAGGWRERKHGNKRRRYVKLHLAVDVGTKEILALEVSTDEVHDSKALPNLLDQAQRRRRVSKALGDGAYDQVDVHEELEARGIEPAIKPRKKSSVDTPSEARRREVKLYKHLGYRRWSKLKGYGRRWMVETAYSTFKGAFGEYSMARILQNITKELVAKTAIYNLLINL
jgi:IS5 family transposase